LAAGVSSAPLNHSEVLEAGQNASGPLGALLSQLVRVL
jgi:purine nucleoside phosphorylase